MIDSAVAERKGTYQGYRPFPIYDLKSGLHLDKAPWLLPKDAYSKVINAYLYQGVLRKRKGIEEWGRIVHFVNDEALGVTVDLQLTYNGTLANTPLRAGDLVISTSGGGETFTDQGDGTLDGDSGGSGTINYTNGAWSITYGANPGGGKNITADYNYFSGDPCVGIFNYYSSAGVSQLLAFDTKRMNKYNTTSKLFEDPIGSDTWTGDDFNFVWIENWLDRMFITNNKDRVKSYDGNNITDLMMDIDGNASNDVTKCLLLFAHKDRLIALRTEENGQLKPQRARACKPGNPDIWDENDGGWYADAPTVDWIMGAEFIGDDLIVWFERSVWMLKYTANPSSPFRWEKIVSTEGCYAPFSMVSFADELLCMGPTGILGCDSFDVYPIDQKIPDIVLEMNPQKIHYTYGTVVEEIRQNWWLYAGMGSNTPDNILSLNYIENSWSIFNLVMHCMGYYSFEADLCWDDVEETMDELEFTWDDKTIHAGYPITLGGSIDGYIYQMDKGRSDDGANISLEIEGGRWNPYIEQGMKARLGYIDFLVDRDPDITVNIDFYVDQLITPYKTETLSCSGEEDKDKVWIRVFCGTMGDFHRIRIYHTAKNQTPGFHAIVPYFKPAGRLGY